MTVYLFTELFFTLSISSTLFIWFVNTFMAGILFYTKRQDTWIFLNSSALFLGILNIFTMLPTITMLSIFFIYIVLKFFGYLNIIVYAIFKSCTEWADWLADNTINFNLFIGRK